MITQCNLNFHRWRQMITQHLNNFCGDMTMLTWLINDLDHNNLVGLALKLLHIGVATSVSTCQHDLVIDAVVQRLKE